MTTSRPDSDGNPATVASPAARPQRPLVARRLTGALMQRIAAQFERPTGLGGELAGRVMAGRHSNVDRNRWLVDLLDVRAGQRLLEVGPGPGIAVAELARRVPDVGIVVVDHSPVMLRQTAARNRDLAAAGRLRAVERPAERIGPDLGEFDRIYSMNVWQFWADQEAVVRTLARRLLPGGLLAVGYQPRHANATAADTDAAGRCLADQLTESGLDVIDRPTLDLAPTPVVVVRARRPTSDGGEEATGHREIRPFAR